MSGADRPTVLQKFAREPGEALRHWPKLSNGEKLYVESRMKQHYGDDFTKAFRQAADGKARPDESVTMTNDPTLTPARLKSMGYRFKDNIGGTPKWTHPSGKELWLLAPPNAGQPPPIQPPGPLPPPQPPIHPDVQDAQDRANDLESRHDALWLEAEQLKALKSPSGSFPAGPFNEYYKKLNKWEEDLKSVLDEEAPLWKADPLTDQEKQKLEEQLKRLEEIKKDEEKLEDLPSS
jgi:hypothetical protein